MQGRSIIDNVPFSAGARGNDGRNRKWKVRRIHELLSNTPALEPTYNRARSVIRLFRKSGFYEITQRCNLKCEGCYYFEGGYDAAVGDETSIETWRRFFGEEQRRGVIMGYFVGAEPALAQERLLAAVEHIPFGIIGTNGTIRIDQAVPYRIQISVWGNDALDSALRGGSVFRKALRNYQGDRRAIVIYTFNRWNIEDTRNVAAICHDHGIKITFNIYSPTVAYLRKLHDAIPYGHSVFDVSRSEDSPILDPVRYAAIRDLSESLMDDFPDTVVYSRAYNRFITAPGPRYVIDSKTGIAENCRSRIQGHLIYYKTNLHAARVKCCTPDVDCIHCRLYSGGWVTRLDPRVEDLDNPTTFQEWLEMVDVFGRIFIYEPRHVATETATVES